MDSIMYFGGGCRIRVDSSDSGWSLGMVTGDDYSGRASRLFAECSLEG